MKSRAHGNIQSIIAASNFNNTFKKIYREFETDIFLKINNKQPAPATLEELIVSGCTPKPSHFFAATCYMRIELTMENVRELRDAIFSQLYPLIRSLSLANIEVMMRTILDTIAKMILQMDLVTFQELANVDFRRMLMNSSSFMKAVKNENTDIESILKNLPEMREKFMHEYNGYTSDLINSKSSLWHLKNFKEEAYQREIESEFVLSASKL